MDQQMDQEQREEDLVCLLQALLTFEKENTVGAIAVA
jgi:hypothetical protein